MMAERMIRVYDRGMLRRLLILVLASALAACAQTGLDMEVNGVEVHDALDRPAVPGGVPWSVAVRMDEGSAVRGRLLIDGVDFGVVHSGDQVRIDRHAVVRVNGTVREPEKE